MDIYHDKKQKVFSNIEECSCDVIFRLKMSMLDTQETEPRIQVKIMENSSENGVSGSDPNSSDAESDPKTQTTQNTLQSGIKPIPKARSSSEIQPSGRKHEFGRRHSAFGNEKQIPSELSREGEEKITNISHDSENLLSKQADKKYATSSKMRRKSGSDKQENISESEDTETGLRMSSDRRHCYTVNDSSEDILALVDLGANRVHRDSTGRYHDYTTNLSDRTCDENEDDIMLCEEETEAERKAIAEKLRDNVSVVASMMYGILMSVLAAVVPITETFASQSPSHMFEIFYIFMYLMSFIFVTYTNVFILKRKSRLVKFLLAIISRVGGLLRNKSDKGAVDGRAREEPSAISRCSFNTDTTHLMYTGSFPLRIGAVVFGVASMVHSGLNFAYFFQVRDGNAQCHHPVQAIKPFMHLTFTFTQLHFIFLHSKLVFTHQKCIARLGLIHLCCTNLAVWFRCIVLETLDVLSGYHHRGSGKIGPENVTETPPMDDAKSSAASRKLQAIPESHMILISLPMNNSNVFPELSCFWSDIFGKFVQTAGPYLYPCKIQYSLICAAIVYAMWRNVGRKPSSQDQNDSVDISKRLDCSSSIRGLFAGILVAVGTVITMVAFYVLVTRHPMSSTAIILIHVSETTMFLLMTASIILVADRMKNMKFKHVSWKFSVELHLLFLSFAGVFAFAVFGVIAAAFETHKPKGVLNILTNLFMILQSTMQVLFIVAGTKLISANESQEQRKRGREYVMFLILCNFALWLMNTFETQQPEHNPVQMDFYGPLAWSVLTHITVPLSIYFRFHSSVCLINIWRFAWRYRSPRETERESSC